LRPVSKSKKQVTNEKRARRLGSGEGIAPARPKAGGIPAWAWLVSGSVLIAAVVIAAVLITRGGSSSGGQNAYCVQQRLSTQKLDPASEPTWPANYDNLQCALTALGLKPSAEGGSIVHYHVHLTLYVNGTKITIPDYIGLAAAGGMSSTVTSEIHTHGRETDPVPGILHIESPNPGFQGTLLEFFDVWGVRATSQCLGGYCDGVKIWINAKPVADGLNTKLVKHDVVTIVVGKPPAGFTPDKSFSFPNGE
jgi:hypothetical protein